VIQYDNQNFDAKQERGLLSVANTDLDVESISASGRGFNVNLTTTLSIFNQDNVLYILIFHRYLVVMVYSHQLGQQVISMEMVMTNSW